ncbi:sensor histidine kinase [Chryseomicrobium palamuruense]|uniref:histidine kinase n=1 Tax=Chryseomicrobium palamuruense TaxID=682973 RepID=A0ABV8UW50_9BACL
MKLKAKIHIYSTLLACITILFVNGLTFFLVQQNAYSNAANPLRNDIQQIAAALTSVQEERDIPTILRAYIPENGAIRVVENNQLLFSIDTVDRLHNYEVAIPPSKPFIQSEWNNQTVLSVATEALIGTGQIVQIQLHQTQQELDDTLTLLMRTFLFVTIAGILLLFTSNFILGRQITAPIEKLISQMRANRQHAAYQEIDVDAEMRDETAQLSREFNAMMRQLEENYRKQEQFVSNASHELKTPLTIIESYANLLKRRGVEDPAVTQEAINAITSETDRMKKLLEQFLELARSTQPVDVDLVWMDLSPIVRQVAMQMERITERTVLLSIPEILQKQMEPSRFRQLLTLLLDNAIKYSEKDVRIEMDSSAIRIHDQGQGIPEDALPHVFDRFYRVDEARSRVAGGSGIGLALAKELAGQVNMDLTLRSEVGLGTTAILTFR